jgi:hypothetical protein
LDFLSFLKMKDYCLFVVCVVLSVGLVSVELDRLLVELDRLLVELDRVWVELDRLLVELDRVWVKSGQVRPTTKTSTDRQLGDSTR